MNSVAKEGCPKSKVQHWSGIEPGTSWLVVRDLSTGLFTLAIFDAIFVAILACAPALQLKIACVNFLQLQCNFKARLHVH